MGAILDRNLAAEHRRGETVIGLLRIAGLVRKVCYKAINTLHSLRWSNRLDNLGRRTAKKHDLFICECHDRLSAHLRIHFHELGGRKFVLRYETDMRLDFSNVV